MAITVLVGYVDDDNYPWGRSHRQWIVCVVKTEPFDNVIYSHYTKPTARQIRQWKKRAKRQFFNSENSIHICSCFECMNRRGLA